MVVFYEILSLRLQTSNLCGLWQNMHRPRRSERGNETFVQWKEPSHSNDEILIVGGDATTSRGKKKKQSRRLMKAVAAEDAFLQSTGVEDFRNEGQASEALSEGRGGTSSRSAQQIHTVNPPPKFMPPRRVHSTRSTVALLASSASERVPDQTTRKEPSFINNTVAPFEVLERQSISRSVEVQGTP